MLMALVLTLRATQAAILPAALGHANYAAVLEHMHHFDPALYAELINGKGSTPLTCSSLLQETNSGNEIIYIQPDTSYQVRVTGLTAPMCQFLQTSFIEQPPELWRLHHHAFAVTEILCDTKLHPWSGRSTYDAMAYHHLYAQRIPLDHVTLNFHSPTACTDRAMIHAVPLPNLVFGNLLERWNGFAEVTLEPAVVQFAKKYMAINSFQLHSQSMYQVGSKQRAGCVGQVTYKVLHGDSYQRALIQLLADFAFYSGVGMETNSGMGQVRRTSSSIYKRSKGKNQTNRRTGNRSNRHPQNISANQK